MQLEHLGLNIKCEINGEELAHVHRTKDLIMQNDECLKWDAYRLIK